MADEKLTKKTREELKAMLNDPKKFNLKEGDTEYKVLLNNISKGIIINEAGLENGLKKVRLQMALRPGNASSSKEDSEKTRKANWQEFKKFDEEYIAAFNKGVISVKGNVAVFENKDRKIFDNIEKFSKENPEVKKNLLFSLKLKKNEIRGTLGEGYHDRADIELMKVPEYVSWRTNSLKQAEEDGKKEATIVYEQMRGANLYDKAQDLRKHYPPRKEPKKLTDALAILKGSKQDEKTLDGVESLLKEVQAEVESPEVGFPKVSLQKPQAEVVKMTPKQKNMEMCANKQKQGLQGKKEKAMIDIFIEWVKCGVFDKMNSAQFNDFVKFMLNKPDLLNISTTDKEAFRKKIWGYCNG